MRHVLQRLWNDDAGFIFSVELMLVFVILILGIIAGLTTLRNAVATELVETGNAIMALNQSYQINGLSGCCGSTGFTNAYDTQSSLANLSCVSGVSMPIDHAFACP